MKMKELKLEEEKRTALNRREQRYDGEKIQEDDEGKEDEEDEETRKLQKSDWELMEKNRDLKQVTINRTTYGDRRSRALSSGQALDHASRLAIPTQLTSEAETQVRFGKRRSFSNMGDFRLNLLTSLVEAQSFPLMSYSVQ